MASISEPVTFREFCPLYYLLNAIPTKIQKGFRSIVVYLTALDTNGDYIAVGSSIGMLYLYCRHLNQMRKYNFEGKTESITVVKLLSCFDDLVAAGTASGRVAVFQLVSSLPGRNKQLRRFDVTGIHKNSITALAWSPNGMKLFSGDDKGKIVYSSLDLDQGLCNSQLVLEEPSSIVQLDYSQKVLLVSTLQRSLLFYTEEKSVRQIGTQPRKSTGKFGACFIPGLCKQSDLTLYASRPGLRLWKADVHGTVQATFILKDAFAGGVKPFELHPLVIIRDAGVWAPSTPPELKPTFKVDMACGEQGKAQLLLSFIPTLCGLGKHTLTGGSGQERQARVQAHAIGAVLLGQKTQHGLRLPIIARPARVPHRDGPARAATH